MASAPTTVIVPVYGGREATARCLESVRRHADATETPFTVLVIDDASPDDGIRDDVDQFARDSGPAFARVIRNPTNLGFVGSVNLGMRSTTGDVVLLNSDTEVTAGWLDRMTDVAASDPFVATVTPLTNSGSICSLPGEVTTHFGLDGPAPQIDPCGRFVAEYGLGERPSVITGVGFCMLITRRAIDEVGLFDEETFGRGYGEEVDFCLRASQLGYAHRVDDQSFVYHAEGVSFGADRVTGMARAKTLLRERYPYFAAANRREQAFDPLSVTFESLRLAIHQRQPGRLQVLHILHRPSDPPGGTERHVEALMSGIEDEVDSAVLSPVESGFLLRTHFVAESGEVVSHQHLLPGGPGQVTKVEDEIAAAALTMALELYDFDAIHIHNLLGHSVGALEVCRSFPGPVVCTLHDLYLACPNHSLLYRDARACGVPDDLSVCASCLPASKIHQTLDYLVEFRDVVRTGLSAIDRFVVADVTAVDYLRRVYDVPDDAVRVIEHGSLIDVPSPPPLDVDHVEAGPLRVAFVGRGWYKKGLQAVNRLAADTSASAIEVHHFGAASQQVDHRVHRHGPYDNSKLPDLLRDAGIHVVLLPGPYAETYSYVMSEAMVAGIPVIGAGYGALGHRIRTHGAGWTIDPDDPQSVIDLVVNLDRCRSELLRATRNARSVAVPPARASARSHIELYRDQTIEPCTAPPSSESREAAMTDDAQMQQHLRALSAVNARLHAQLGERTAPSRGQRFAARSRGVLEQRAPRVYGVLLAGFEAFETCRRLVSSARSTARRRSTTV